MDCFGVAAASTLLILLFIPFNPTALVENVRGQVNRILLQRGIDIFAGVLLLVSGLWLWLSRGKPRKEKKDRGVRAVSAGNAFLLGFANTLAGTSGIATMYVTSRVLGGVSSLLVVQVPVYCIFLVGLLGPYALLIFAWDRYPRFATILTRIFDRVGSYDFRPLIALLVMAAGAIFLWLGIFVR